jgi:hypothetical protein
LAKKQTVQFIDDLDGKVLDEFETIRWAVDGREYEFDTSPKHAQQFRNSIEKYLTVSRRVGPKNTRTVAAVKSKSSRTQAIREWALREGYEVSSRGRIPLAVAEAFEAAH